MLATATTRLIQVQDQRLLWPPAHNGILYAELEQVKRQHYEFVVAGSTCTGFANVGGMDKHPDAVAEACRGNHYDTLR